MRLTKEAIVTAQDIITQEVDVPEWGGVVEVRRLSAYERMAFRNTVISKAGDDVNVDTQRAQILLVAMAMSDPVMSEDELGAKAAVALDRVYRVAADLNGMTDKAVEEMVKNSETPSTSSATD